MNMWGLFVCAAVLIISFAVYFITKGRFERVDDKDGYEDIKNYTALSDVSVTHRDTNDFVSLSSINTSIIKKMN